MHWLSGSKKGREIEDERKRGIKREGKREKGGWIGGEGEGETGFYNGAAVIPVSE